MGAACSSAMDDDETNTTRNNKHDILIEASDRIPSTIEAFQVEANESERAIASDQPTKRTRPTSTAERPATSQPQRPRRSLRITKDNSLLRVGSRIFSAAKKKGSGGQATPSKRASTYDHVHDAVMQNFQEAGVTANTGNAPAGVVGLRNLGNTCFINSSLQCLSNTIPLTDYFLGYDYRKEINKDNFLGTGGKLASAYAELMKEMWLKQKSVVLPSTFKRSLSTFAPQFSGNFQHDAQELLSFLLDGIHEDLNRVKDKPYIEDKDCDGTNDEQDAILAWKNYLLRNRSLVVDIFQGQFRNTCRCKECNHQNIRFETFMYLSLPIADSCKTLEDCLDIYLEEEELTGDNQWYCSQCKKHTDATKKTDLWVLPPILIIHLKRFKYDEFGRAGRKNEAVLQYPIKSWDLSKNIKSRGGGLPIYDMYAVSNHLGGLGGGHYTAYGLNRFNDEWYEFNDSTYRRINPQATFARSKSPYLLFYNRAQNTPEMRNKSANGRQLLIRRQSVSRPELWPHAQVREGQFRDFKRSTTSLMQSQGRDTPMTSVSEDEKKRPANVSSSMSSEATDDDDVPAAVRNKSSNKKKKKSKKATNGKKQVRRSERLRVKSDGFEHEC